MSMPQSDLNLIKAITEGLAYLRKNPWQLDYIFQDVLSSNLSTEFGREEIARAKKWFLKTEIPVVGVYRLDKPIYPCVTVSVVSSVESKEKASLGEIDPQASPYDNEMVRKQDLVSIPDMVAGPFSPSYDIATGLVTLPTGFDTEIVFVGQGLYSPSSHTTYPITEITSDSSFKIAMDVRDNFTNSYIVPAYDMLKVMRHLANFDEQYEINCCVKGTPGEVYWLHSIILYVLLQRRQYLFEKYNIGLTSLSCGEITVEADQSPENFFNKPIMMSGYVEVRWVDALSELYEGINSTVNLVKEDDDTIFSSLET